MLKVAKYISMVVQMASEFLLEMLATSASVGVNVNEVGKSGYRAKVNVEPVQSVSLLMLDRSIFLPL